MAETWVVRHWRVEPSAAVFPEMGTDLPSRTAPVGVCLSGGGTRALSAGMGQLRALNALGLLARTRYLSCVSGGSWLATSFTYNATSGTDEEFLGPITAPEHITLASLIEALPTECVGATATREISGVFNRNLLSGMPRDRVWCACVGELYFSSFGLYDPARPTSFTLDAAHRDDILQRIPSLRPQDLHVARPLRPYLIVNGTIVGLKGLLPLEEINPTTLEFTPIYSGSHYGWEVVFRARDRRWASHWLGGSLSENVALGAAEAVSVDAAQTLAVYPRPERLFGLADASGTSSSFLAGFAESLPFGLSETNPTLQIQPILPPDAKAETFHLGDGGVVENFGLLALMRRKVPRAIVFINTAVPLDLDYDARTQTPTEKDLDPYLAPLFGLTVKQVGVQTDANRVFRASEFVTVVEALQAARRAGGPVLARTRHDVQANVWWGVEGGWSIDVLWVYLEHSSDFEDAIGDKRVRDELDKRDRPLRMRQGRFAGFPHYSTSFHNGLDLVKLTPEQVKLLADFTCWTVLAASEVFHAMFDLTPQA